MREWEKAQRMALRIQDALLQGKSWSMAVERCGKLGTDLGYSENAGIKFPERHPRVFQVFESHDKPGAKHVRFSPEAKNLVSEERTIAKDPYCVYVLRKLLMLCKGEKIHTVKLMRNRCFNFPEALTHKVLTRYPNYFHWDKRPLSKWGTLRLVSWDEDLAVPIREKTLELLRQQNDDGISQVGVPVENGCGLETVVGSKELLELHALPLMSPYNRSEFCSGDKLAERKRKIGLLHEFLSLVKLKKACLNDIIDLLEEFQLGDEALLEPFINKERKFFITRRVEGRTHVFLREGYEWDHHAPITPCLQAKREFLNLLTVDNKADKAAADKVSSTEGDDTNLPAKTTAALPEG